VEKIIAADGVATGTENFDANWLTCNPQYAKNSIDVRF
jgi:hypothetical protein